MKMFHDYENLCKGTATKYAMDMCVRIHVSMSLYIKQQ